MHQLTLDQARRIAVRAQLLDAERPTDLVDVVRQLTFVQLEPTAAIAPTADLVLWSRLGNGYRPADLQAALEVDSRLVELDLLVRPMEDLSLFLAQMAVGPPHPRMQRWLEDNDPFREDILDRLELDGPLTGRELEDTSIVPWQSSGWNANRNVAMMLDALAASGEVAVAARRGRDRLWDLAERVYHSDIRGLPLDEATRERNTRRLRSQGVVSTTTPELPTEPTKVGDAGEAAIIDGLRGTWRVDPDAVAGLAEPFAGRTALLSPFDGLIRDRRRMALLWDFDYALEMYKPVGARRWGYYALPVLHGDRLVGKVDATADPDSASLVVHALHEDGGWTRVVRDAVVTELEALASWLQMRLVLPRPF